MRLQHSSGIMILIKILGRFSFFLLLNYMTWASGFTIIRPFSNEQIMLLKILMMEKVMVLIIEMLDLNKMLK